MVSPNELFECNAQEHLVRPMAEQGFSYSSKERMFRRDRPPFEQIVDIKFRRACRENYCEFDPRFEIRSKDYERWYRQIWGEDPPDHRADLLFSAPAYFNDGWPKRGNFVTRHLPWKIRPGGRTKFFRLTNASRDRREMKEVAEAMLEPLMEGFDALTSWNALAEYNKGLYATFGLACECYLIGGRRDLAQQFLEEALNREDELRQENHGHVVEDLRLRNDKYFGPNGLFLPVEPKDGSTE